MLEEYEIVLASGNRIAFIPTACTDNSYEYSYYLNGNYEAKYIISSLDWSLTRIDAKTGDAAVVASNLGVPSEPPEDYTTDAYAAQVQAGSIIYNYSPELGGSPRSDVYYVSRSSSQHQVAAERGDDVGTVVGMITSALISLGFCYFAGASIAETLLVWAFEQDAGLIVNGIFTSMATEIYTTYTSVYDVTVNTYGSNVMAHGHVYSGAERWASCRNYYTSTADYDVQGVTVRNWNSGSNVQMFWTDAYGRVPNPGYRVIYG